MNKLFFAFAGTAILLIGIFLGVTYTIYQIEDTRNAGIEPFNYIIVDGKEFEVIHDGCISKTDIESNDIWIRCQLNEVDVFIGIGHEYYISTRR